MTALFVNKCKIMLDMRRIVCYNIRNKNKLLQQVKVLLSGDQVMRREKGPITNKVTQNRPSVALHRVVESKAQIHRMMLPRP